MHHVADGSIALGILLEVAGQRRPSPQVVPVETTIGYDHVLSFFHQGEIDAYLRNLGVFLGQDCFKPLGPFGRRGKPTLAGLVHLRLVLGQRVGEGHKRPHEHSGVPSVMPRGEVFLSFFQGGFFHEPLDLEERGLECLARCGCR